MKASSASIAGVAISTPVSADSNEDDRNTANRDSPYQPDVRIIDNSSDDKPIDVSYRRVTEEADADKQQPDTDTQQVGTDDREIDSITVNTVGINSQQLHSPLHVQN
ncbi:hypothetical protein [Halobiforma nitratireducens]|uniref:hypothetical protein n=1 Tax=Halobiforma nitratireducens TaxID=130048 RepID=UPI0012684BB1|nr:hypothetical protein [Halobiforma nitratireducens]